VVNRKGGQLAARKKYHLFPSARFCRLRLQAARPPKNTPARVRTQMVMVTAYSLVVIMISPETLLFPVERPGISYGN